MESHAPHGNAITRLPRLLMRRIVYVLVLLGALIKPRLGMVLLVAVLLGIIAFQSVALITPLFARSPTDGRVALIEPADAVTTFLQGQREFDADKIWDSFSADFQAALLEQNTSKDYLAQQLEQAREAGQGYRSANYIGGVTIENNQQMFFYVVEMAAPNAQGNSTVSFVFTVDSNGKIVSIH